MPCHVPITGILKEVSLSPCLSPAPRSCRALQATIPLGQLRSAEDCPAFPPANRPLFRARLNNRMTRALKLKTQQNSPQHMVHVPPAVPTCSSKTKKRGSTAALPACWSRPRANAAAAACGSASAVQLAMGPLGLRIRIPPAGAGAVGPGGASAWPLASLWKPEKEGKLGCEMPTCRKPNIFVCPPKKADPAEGELRPGYFAIAARAALA